MAKKLEVKDEPVPCETCNVTGLQDKDTLCPNCQGTGKI